MIFIYGQGFQAGESYKIYWDYQQLGQAIVGTGVTDSTGSFTALMGSHSDPNVVYVTVAAIGMTSRSIATTTVHEVASLGLNRSSASRGTRVGIGGGGFGANETVTVFFNSVAIATATSDSTGGFHTSFVVPPHQPGQPGDVMLQAIANTSGVSVSIPFAYAPHLVITPTTGGPGTGITVTGGEYSASSTISLVWYDPSTGTSTPFGTATTNSVGAFTTTITAPNGLVSGNTYYIRGYDHLEAQATFTAN